MPTDTPQIEIEPPDLAKWQHSGTGVPYTATIGSDVPGPHLVLTSVMHGNEFGGAIAASRILESGFRPQCGTLSVVFLNVAAMQRFRPDAPEMSRYIDEDMNRLWDEQGLSGAGISSERTRAAAVRRFIDDADHVLDLHSTQDMLPPITMAGMTEKSMRVAVGMGFPLWIVRDPGHMSGRRMIEYPRFADPDTPKTALLVECGQHWSPQCPTIALEVAFRWMIHFGVARRDDVREVTPMHHRGLPCVVEITDVVTVWHPQDFSFVRPFRGIEIIPERGTVIAREGSRDIITPYDNCILLMPARQPYRGLTAVRLGRIVMGEAPRMAGGLSDYDGCG